MMTSVNRRVEIDVILQVIGSTAMKTKKHSEQFEINTFFYWEPVKFSQMRCDVIAAF